MYTHNVFIATINNKQEFLISDFSLDMHKIKSNFLSVSSMDYDENDNEIEHRFEVNLNKATNISVETDVFDENDNEFFILQFYLNEKYYELHFPKQYFLFFKSFIED